MHKRSKLEKHEYDVAVVGGGMAGICAAVASARGGAKTVLIQDRPVLGGNASSEIRMHICGASANRLKRDAEETGILHEILLDNKACNDYYNYSVWDRVLLSKVRAEDNLTLLLNTSMQDVDCEENAITGLHCYQLTTEKHMDITAKIYIDCSGNGSLAYFAGEEYRSGCESKAEFDEPDAPDIPNMNRMGNTLLFKAIDRGHPVEFVPPEWSRHFSEEDLKYRKHGNYCPNTISADDVTVGEDNASFACFGLDYGYWWIELPSNSEDYVDDYENIRDELVQCIYGVWDHIKNVGDHGAENYDLQWVGMLPGVRESRRFKGKYVLTENDVLANARFQDAVAYGGWPIDNHAPRGIDDTAIEPSFVRQFDGLYTIPYRCYCSDNFVNLMYAGKIISATKLAMASSRVMGTCAVGGQAVGTAAAMCVQKGIMPYALIETVDELQQQLLKDDCFIPDVKNTDVQDFARSANVSATSFRQEAPPQNVINGVARNQNGIINLWESDGLREAGETLSLSFDEAKKVKTVHLTFDSNLNRPKKITLSAKRIAEQQVGVPVELVKDYRVELIYKGEMVAAREINGNYQRLNTVDFGAAQECDRVNITVLSTNGCDNARIFEVRVYGD